MAEMWRCPEQSRISSTPLKVEVNFHAFSVTDGGKCGFPQLIFLSFRSLFLVSPSPRTSVLLTSHSTSELQLHSATLKANQQVAHTCHGAYSDLTLTWRLVKTRNDLEKGRGLI
jgi:hypothetical protein